MIFFGKVVSGRGIAGSHIKGCTELLLGILDGPPVLGTLNVLLNKPIHFDPDEAAVIAKDNRMFWPLKINGHPCLAYRWQGCPLHVVEVVSDVVLREQLGLEDNERVFLQSSTARPASKLQHLAWTILWRGRSRWFYSRDKYLRWTENVGFAKFSHQRGLGKAIK